MWCHFVVFAPFTKRRSCLFFVGSAKTEPDELQKKQPSSNKRISFEILTSEMIMDTLLRRLYGPAQNLVRMVAVTLYLFFVMRVIIYEKIRLNHA
jgi:hypothetical protein